MKRRIPEIRIMLRMIITVDGLKSSGPVPRMQKRVNTISVRHDTGASKNNMTVKGFVKAMKKLPVIDFFFSPVMLLLPYLVRFKDTAFIEAGTAMQWRGDILSVSAAPA